MNHEFSGSMEEIDQIGEIHTKRLQRLLRLKQENLDIINPIGLKLMNRSINATYNTCLITGHAEEAKKMVEMAKNPLPNTPPKGM